MSAQRPILTLALVALALWAAPAGAQQSSRARAQDALPAELFSRVDALARASEAEGIPADFLFNKALEGMAKRVPAERIAPAVEAYLGRLRDARTAFGPEAAPPLLAAGADALQRGVGAELLHQLGQSRERSPLACLVLADLVETGADGDQALSLVREAMRLRAREQQMLDMPAQVRRLMRQGQSAADAMEQVRRGLRRGGGGMTPPVAPGGRAHDPRAQGLGPGLTASATGARPPGGTGGRPRGGPTTAATGRGSSGPHPGSGPPLPCCRPSSRARGARTPAGSSPGPTSRKPRAPRSPAADGPRGATAPRT